MYNHWNDKVGVTCGSTSDCGAQWGHWTQ